MPSSPIAIIWLFFNGLEAMAPGVKEKEISQAWNSLPDFTNRRAGDLR
jgi:hypothetical protein